MNPLARWNDYWFRPTPVLHLAIARVVIVGFHLGFLLWWRPHTGEFVELAALPDALFEPLPLLSLLCVPLGWGWRPPLEFMQTAYWIALVAGTLGLVGLRTNLSLALFAYASVLLRGYAWSYGEFHHPEAIMMMALPLMAIGPSGAVLSVDELRKRVRRAADERRVQAASLAAPTSEFARWPLLVIQWMFVLVYFSAAYYKHKAGGLDWINGYTLQYYVLQDALRFDAAVGIWMAGQPLWQLVFLSVYTIFFEATFVLAVLFPVLAWLYVPMGVALHTGIYVMVKAPFFQYVALYVVFVQWVPISRRVSEWLGERPRQRAQVFYDGKCPLCIRSMTILHYLDWLGHVTPRDLEEEWELLRNADRNVSLEDCRREMHVLFPDGSVEAGYPAIRRLLWKLPLGWPLLPLFYLPFAGVVGPTAYRAVATRRTRLESCDSDTCSLHP